MFNFEIRTGKPANRSRKGRNTKYPFGAMTVGTYFDVPADHEGAQVNKNRAARVQGSAHSYGRQNDMKFQTERLDNGDVRVYRVE